MHPSLASALQIPTEESGRQLTRTDCLLLLQMPPERWAPLTTDVFLRVVRIAGVDADSAMNAEDIRTAWIMKQVSLRQIREELRNLKQDAEATESDLVVKRLELLPAFSGSLAERSKQVFFIDALEDKIVRLNARVQSLRERYVEKFPIENAYASVKRLVAPHFCLPSRWATAPKYYGIEPPLLVGPVLRFGDQDLCLCAYEQGVDIPLDIFEEYPKPGQVLPQPI